MGITRQDRSPNKIRKKADKGHTNKFWSKVFFPRASVDPKKLSEALTQSNLFLVRAKGHVSGPDAKIYEVQSVGHRSYIKLANKHADNKTKKYNKKFVSGNWAPITDKIKEDERVYFTKENGERI